MSKLPPIKDFKKEDFSGVEWIDKLLWPLNRFMASVYSALNQGLTFNENFRAQSKEFSFTHTTSIYPLQFSWNIRGANPTDLWVTRVVHTNGTTAIGAVWAEWDYDGSSVSIQNFTGLATDEDYKIRIIAVAE